MMKQLPTKPSEVELRRQLDEESSCFGQVYCEYDPKQVHSVPKHDLIYALANRKDRHKDVGNDLIVAFYEYILEKFREHQKPDGTDKMSFVEYTLLLDRSKRNFYKHQLGIICKNITFQSVPNPIDLSTPGPTTQFVTENARTQPRFVEGEPVCWQAVKDRSGAFLYKDEEDSQPIGRSHPEPIMIDSRQSTKDRSSIDRVSSPRQIQVNGVHSPSSPSYQNRIIDYNSTNKSVFDHGSTYEHHSTTNHYSQQQVVMEQTSERIVQSSTATDHFAERVHQNHFADRPHNSPTRAADAYSPGRVGTWDTYSPVCNGHSTEFPDSGGKKDSLYEDIPRPDNQTCGMIEVVSDNLEGSHHNLDVIELYHNDPARPVVIGYVTKCHVNGDYQPIAENGMGYDGSVDEGSPSGHHIGKHNYGFDALNLSEKRSTEGDRSAFCRSSENRDDDDDDDDEDTTNVRRQYHNFGAEEETVNLAEGTPYTESSYPVIGVINEEVYPRESTHATADFMHDRFNSGADNTDRYLLTTRPDTSPVLPANSDTEALSEPVDSLLETASSEEETSDRQVNVNTDDDGDDDCFNERRLPSGVFVMRHFDPSASCGPTFGGAVIGSLLVNGVH